MPRIEVATENGHPLSLHVTDVGQGAPVVLLHPWPLSQAVWEGQVGALVAAGHRVVAVDRRGFGQSDPAWFGHEPDTLADDLARVLTVLDLQDAALVGAGIGALEVVRMLSRQGAARVTRIALVGTPTPWLLRHRDHRGGAWTPAEIDAWRKAVVEDRPAWAETMLERLCGVRGRAAIGAAWRRHLLNVALMASPKATHDAIATFATTDLRADLASIAVPTLVLHGEADALAPFDVCAVPTHRAIADSELAVIRRAPHLVMLSHREEFNAALLKFLARTAGPRRARTMPLLRRAAASLTSAASPASGASAASATAAPRGLPAGLGANPPPRLPQVPPLHRHASPPAPRVPPPDVESSGDDLPIPRAYLE